MIMGCIFCDILAGRIPGHMLYSDQDHVAFLDKYPIDLGHCLIIPRTHYERITDMRSDAVGRLFSLVPRIASTIMVVTGADAFSVGQNNGRAANQIVPHVHVHIIPRYNKRGAVWTKRSILDDADLAKLAEKIRARLS